MKVVFRKEAEADLRSIIDYFEGVAPEAVGNIMSDIHRSINLLSHFPHSGTPVPERHFRRIVTIKYHFKLVYEVSEEQIVVLGVFRYQDREVGGILSNSYLGIVRHYVSVTGTIRWDKVRLAGIRRDGRNPCPDCSLPQIFLRHGRDPQG